MKKAVLHTTTLTHCRARQVLLDLFNTNQVNGSSITFVAGVTKINLKNLKIYLLLDDLMQETIWGHQLYKDGRFEPLANSGRSFTWGYKLKALK